MDEVVNLDSDSVLEASFKGVTGYANILYHLVIRANLPAIKEADNVALDSLRSVEELAKTELGRIKQQKELHSDHLYYSIYDHHGNMMTTTIPPFLGD